MNLKTFYHFTEKPFVFNKSTDYSQFNKVDEFLGRRLKPRGLWISDESEYGWSQWSIDNEFMTGNLEHKTAIKVNLDEILVISNYKSLQLFAEDFF